MVDTIFRLLTFENNECKLSLFNCSLQGGFSMIVRIGMVLLVILLIYLAIALIVRAFPTVFSRRNKERIIDMGGRAYIPWYGRGAWGFFVAIFMGPFLVTGVADSEQRRVLKNELARLKQRVKTLTGTKPKRLKPITNAFADMADDWERQINGQEFDFLPLRNEIIAAERHVGAIGKIFPQADGLIDVCYQLLPLAGQAAQSDADLNMLTEVEKELDEYAGLGFDVGDLPTWQKLVARLGLIKKTLEECTTGASQAASSAAKDYYAVLGVDSKATRDEIKSAYRALAHKYHPDKKAEELKKITDPDVRQAVSDEFDNKLKDINEAYRILSDPALRADYDKKRT